LHIRAEEHSERVNIARVRELRIKIRNELAELLADVNGGGDGSQFDEPLLYIA
jgi:hypothetical protein